MTPNRQSHKHWDVFSLGYPETRVLFRVLCHNKGPHITPPANGDGSMDICGIHHNRSQERKRKDLARLVTMLPTKTVSCCVFGAASSVQKDSGTISEKKMGFVKYGERTAGVLKLLGCLSVNEKVDTACEKYAVVARVAVIPLTTKSWSSVQKGQRQRAHGRPREVSESSGRAPGKMLTHRTKFTCIGVLQRVLHKGQTPDETYLVSHTSTRRKKEEYF
ncbi:hypothetical protein C8R47DRAFT_1065340 [Mycena vitilis]|nr:hypothetical protein C8R47DRAFT_1065340 [Mycena vitilis]